MKEKEEEYSETMEELPDESVGIPVNNPKGNDIFFAFSKKPKFPNSIFQGGNNFRPEKEEVEIEYESMEIDTKELEYINCKLFPVSL